MIPKLIHYCWFGQHPMPEQLQRCLASWRRFCPDYTIIEWNETNYDITKIPYTAEAYNQKQWAYVSDYVRLDVVYQYGGIYLDVDVELLRPLDSLLEQSCFFGCEIANDIATGLCFGAVKKHWFVKENMSVYESHTFGELPKTCVEITTDLLITHGLSHQQGIIKIEDMTIYPPEYFNPIHFWTHQLNITENTYAIHHGFGSWVKKSLIPMKYKIAVRLGVDRVFGYGTYRQLLRRLKMKK